MVVPRVGWVLALPRRGVHYKTALVRGSVQVRVSGLRPHEDPVTCVQEGRLGQGGLGRWPLGGFENEWR